MEAKNADLGVVMGVIGGFLPAVRAARLNIVNALRAS
jgi:ABC-type antimicrobial peptide transport system permease subunit